MGTLKCLCSVSLITPCVCARKHVCVCKISQMGRNQDGQAVFIPTYLMKYSEALSAFKQISYSVSQGQVINLGVEHSLVFHFYS